MQVLDMNSIKETLETEGFDSPGSVVLLTTDDLQDMKIKSAHQKHLLDIIKVVSNRKGCVVEPVVAPIIKDETLHESPVSEKE